MRSGRKDKKGALCRGTPSRWFYRSETVHFDSFLASWVPNNTNRNHSETISFYRSETSHLLEIACPFPINMATNGCGRLNLMEHWWQNSFQWKDFAAWRESELDSEKDSDTPQIFCRFWCASGGHVFVQAMWRTACVKFLQWRFWQGEGWKSIDEAHSMTWAGSWPFTPCYAGHRPLVSHTWHVHAT